MKNKLLVFVVFVMVFTSSNCMLYAQDTVPVLDSSTIVMDSSDACADVQISDGADDTILDDYIEITDPVIGAVASGELEKIAEFIAQDGIGVNYAEPVLGLTPLIIAVSCGHESVVTFLLAQPGIEVNKSMHDGLSPLLCVVMQNNSTLLALLLAMPGIEVAAADEYGNTAESLAADAGHAECLALLQKFSAS